MIIYKSGLTAGAGPDYIRLKNRYEVTNGQHQVTEEMMLMRTCSYMMMIGPTNDVNEIIQS